MGMFLADTLCMEHDVALYARHPEKLRYCLNTRRFTTYDEIREFDPELLINCVTIKNTLPVFNEVLPYVSKDCVLSDIASVKTGLPEFYAQSGHRYVSTHPMFGPTFANLSDLSQNYAIIIKEGDPATVTIPALGDRAFAATVDKISWYSTDMKVGTPSFYNIELTVPNPEFELKPGFKVVAEFARKPH